jgi:hypothetical protein
VGGGGDQKYFSGRQTFPEYRSPLFDLTQNVCHSKCMKYIDQLEEVVVFVICVAIEINMGRSQ